jgi:CHAD domain-containing protein
MAFDQTETLNNLRAVRSTIIAEDAIAEAGRKAMLDDFISLIEHETGARDGTDSEETHKMRVATRRIRSALRLLKRYYKVKIIQPFIEILKEIASHLGAVRDLDVLIDALSTHKNTLSPDDQLVFNIVIDYLNSQRQKAQKKLGKFFNSASYQKFLANFHEFVTHEGAGVPSIKNNNVAPYQVRHILPVIIHTHLANIRAYETTVDTVTITTLHELRIEFKQLRYIISYFTDALGTSAEKFLIDLKTIQDYLGELHDLSVAQSHLKSLIKTAGLDKTQGKVIKDYIHVLSEIQNQRIENFADVWEKFNTRAVQRKLSDALLVLR